jgi:HEAT repeat protein
MKSAIAALISILETTDNEDTRWSVADILGKIAVGNEKAIASLIQFSKLLRMIYRIKVADSLGKIAVGNESAIASLISILETTQMKIPVGSC